MYKLIIWALLTLILSGCPGSPLKLGMMSPGELRYESPENLCNAYNFNQKDTIEQELRRRNIFTTTEWVSITQNKVQLGMSELALICSWGLPSSINETVGSWGVHKQFVYRACDTCQGQYIYTENGKVTSWQN
ncbi:MAG: hypothetical protein KAT62_12485 [Desulfuromonadales bacterium]|nr:hypothetical protein [Desulfuromonadales bacterium]